MHRLQDRVAVVFGAGSVGPGWGNGKASAVAYARAGAIVCCVDVNEAAARETADIISNEGGKTPLWTACDVTNEVQVKATVDRVEKQFGRIDILHNNVGTTKMGGPPDLSLDDWHRQLDINLTGAFLACKYVIPVMQRQKRGVITNISSSAGLRYTGYPYA
ncbi:MAG: SDR family NAD(P)-dependent oxidoreductase, partial [Beijerinckiaceae bacterium]